MSMKKIAIVLLSAALSMCLFGCSGGGTQFGGSKSEPKSEPKSTEPAIEKTDSKETPKPLELVESGWSVGESGYVHYGVGFKNPNTSFEARFPTIKVTGKDSDGKILFSEDQVLSFMLPGATYYYGGQAGNGTAPETVDFSLSVSDRNWIANDKQSMEIYTISNINEVIGDYGDVDYTGEITANEEWSDVGSAMVNVILRDDSGNIIFGEFGFADISKAGETIAFDISSYNVPEHSSYEIYAQPWM